MSIKEETHIGQLVAYNSHSPRSYDIMGNSQLEQLVS